MPRWLAILLPLTMLLGFRGSLRADVISLRTGERLIGKVLAEESTKIIFDSAGLGRLEIPRERIEKLELSAPAPSAAPQIAAPALTLGTNTPAEAHALATLLPWRPLPPDAKDDDWIQLKSGEWLKGRLKGMQDRKLDFISDELDDQEFDWKDIHQVRSLRMISVLFNDRQTVSGPVTITREQVTVEGLTPVVRPRTDLDSLTPGGQTELSLWSGKAAIGLTLRAGNSEQTDYTAQFTLERRTPGTRLSLDYIGNASSVDGVESANNHRVNAEFDLWLSRRFYLLLPAAEYLKDVFQNIDRRVTVGVGVGYDLIDRRNLNWNITAGPAYQKTWFHSVEPGVAEEKGAAALTFGSEFDWDITRRIEVILEYRGQYTSKEVGETTHHSVSTLSLELTRRLDLDVSFIWDRVTKPKPASDGTVPKQDDFRLVVGLGLDF